MNPQERKELEVEISKRGWSNKSGFQFAEIALDAMKKLERLMKEKVACLVYCEVQNGLPYCKNCGLGTNETDEELTRKIKETAKLLGL